MEFETHTEISPWHMGHPVVLLHPSIILFMILNQQVRPGQTLQPSNELPDLKALPDASSPLLNPNILKKGSIPRKMKLFDLVGLCSYRYSRDLSNQYFTRPFSAQQIVRAQWVPVMVNAHSTNSLIRE